MSMGMHPSEAKSRLDALFGCYPEWVATPEGMRVAHKEYRQLKKKLASLEAQLADARNRENLLRGHLRDALEWCGLWAESVNDGACSEDEAAKYEAARRAAEWGG